MVIVLKRRKRQLGAAARARRGEGQASLLRPSYATKTPPCTNACPNENDMRGCLTLICQSQAAGQSYDEAMLRAWKRITSTNPLPGVCGQVCPHPCESECNRQDKDVAVNISAVEWAIGDYGVKHSLRHQKIRDESYPEKIAIIGSGPAGLSCAFQLARRGYPVTIYETFSKPGGMLRWGIPDYRLNKKDTDAEIKAILELGIDMKYNTRVGKDVSLDQLIRQYQAVFVGIGGHTGVKLGVPGENMPNVLSGADFLHRVNEGKKVDLGERVIVIGGGNSAIDAARVARRLSAEVTLYYRRTRKEMPAIEHEIVGAEEEGVKFEFLSAPVAILNDGKNAIGARFIRMKLGEPDASGRAKPLPIEGSEFNVDATAIIPSISQTPDFQGLEAVRNAEGWISVNDKYQTAIPGVFAGGDVTNKLGLVTEAIGMGRHAAEAIDAYLRGSEPKKESKAPIIRSSDMRLSYYSTMPRNEAPVLPVAERINSFKPITTALVEDQVTSESKRCMSCGLCFGCDVCFSYCQDGAVKRAPEGSPYKYMFETTICTGCKKCAEECPCGFIDMS